MKSYFANALNYVLNFSGYVVGHLFMLVYVMVSFIDFTPATGAMIFGLCVHGLALSHGEDYESNPHPKKGNLMDYYAMLFMTCFYGFVISLVLMIFGLNYIGKILLVMYLLFATVPFLGEAYILLLSKALSVFSFKAKQKKEDLQKFADDNAPQ
ncbi:MAG: hypothetical protein VX730_07690 [Pseudomonadota bacterium]|nr:hypothetical protein [Pseudomonadota bacterium]